MLSEIKVNPPGETDAPDEFVDICGRPLLLLTNVYLLALEGNSSADPGTVNYRLDLTSTRLGANGLSLVAAPGHPAIPSATTRIEDARLAGPGGAFDNGTLTMMLVSSPSDIPEGEDLDRGDNGVLEGLPDEATILDVVAWSDGEKTMWSLARRCWSWPVVRLTRQRASRAMIARIKRTLCTPVYLAGDEGNTLAFDSKHLSDNFRPGTLLTPAS